MLVAGFAVVLLLALGLMSMVRDASPPAVATRAPERAEPVAEAPAAAPEAAPARPAPVAAHKPRPTTSARRTAEPSLAPAATGYERAEMKRDENGHLVPMLSIAELRAMLPQTSASVAACLEAMGQRATGEAVLNFTIVAKDGKLAVESTGVQDEKSLANSPELLGCLHQSARALVLEGHPVPELGTAIYVRRSISIENGGLANDAIVSFSYNP